MKLIILGSTGLDNIKTYFGEVKNALGGAAVYACTAASFFEKPGMISVRGKDFPKEYVHFLESKNIDMKGTQVKGKNFRWSGSYNYDMNEAKTLKTELNSLETFEAEVPEEYKDAKYVFLANTDPDQQLKVIEQLNNPKLVVLDTMNLWINIKKESLLKAIKKIDVLILNDGEARQLFDTPFLIKAGKEALKSKMKAVIIKKGEHGSLLFMNGDFFSAPGYPLEKVKDPTGCGDSFGGGFIGYLAKTDDISKENMRKAVIYGSVIASFNAEEFSLNKQREITIEDIEKRYREFGDLRKF